MRKSHQIRQSFGVGECGKMIGIRADGNEKIGTGHIMRCLSIGEAVRKKGGEPVFFSIDAEALIRQAGFKCIPLQGVYDDLNEEDLSSLLHASGIATLLVDSYFADAIYFKKLHGHVKTAVIFDMGDGKLPVDLLVNYNLDYASHEYSGPEKLLLGCSYAPLRTEFQNMAFKRKFDAVKNIMITTGGTDKYNITVQAIRMIRAQRCFDKIALHVVVGALNIFAGDVKRIKKETKGLFVYENCRNMAELMEKCDVVVSAGGSTLYEICACGAPCIPFSMADNQDNVVDVMGEKGVMLPAGHYEQDPEGCMAAILENLKLLAKDAVLRKQLSQNAVRLVDGKGAGRIADALIDLDEEK